MQAVLLDSSVYVAALRGKETVIRLERITGGTVLWLSAVVLEELHAGAGIRDREYVERMEHGFEEAGKILVPDLSDWIAAGKALARLALKYNHGKIGRSRLTNDALIAMSAARMGIHVITQNARDFQKLAEFSALSWQLAPL